MTLGKAFPYPSAGDRLELCPCSCTRRRASGMEPAGPTRRRSACSCSIQGLCTPAQVAAFRVLWGHLRGFSLCGLRQRMPSRAATGGEVVNGPKCWTYKHRVQGVKVGARIAPNAFATAEDGDCTEAPQVCRPRGVSFWAAPKRAAIIPHSRRALSKVQHIDAPGRATR